MTFLELCLKDLVFSCKERDRDCYDSCLREPFTCLQIPLKLNKDRNRALVTAQRVNDSSLEILVTDFK